MNNTLNPYNPKNIKLNYNHINDILKKVDLKLKVNNINLYQSSLLHKSYTLKNNYEN